MGQGWRVLTVGLLGVQAIWQAGCADTRTAALGVERLPLSTDLALEETPRVARLQQGDAGVPKFAPPSAMPASLLPAPGANAPPKLPGASTSPAAPNSVAPPLPPAATVPSGTKQTSMIAPRTNNLSVRAWVNGRPILDDEIMQAIPPQAYRMLSTLSSTQRTEKLGELFNQTLDQIIEQEVIYQEAIHKLEKGNPVALQKLKKMAEEDFQKQLDKVRNSKKVSSEEVKEFERQMRRPTERSFVSMYYMRSRIIPILEFQINFQEIKDYFDAHPSEFQKIESVKWQDVFIAVGPQHPTLADARRFGEELIAQCRTGADFIRLSQFDDGDAKTRGGEGLGSERGKIRPPELEPYLFKLRDGQIGPIVPLSTGVHLFRLVKREPGGPMPLDETVQNQIRSKLRNQLSDREYRRIVRELRSRAVVEVVRDGE
jgi:peptidyl-prolyl cis-trans isomerase SurA